VVRADHTAPPVGVVVDCDVAAGVPTIAVPRGGTLALVLVRVFTEPIGLLSKPHRFFGYNNPDPSPGSPNYGYDQWITVDATIQPAEPIKLTKFPGGLYAVTRCMGVQNIPSTWKQLVVWCEDSQYRTAHHQWLEECLTPPGVDLDKLELDLYLPIAE